MPVKSANAFLDEQDQPSADDFLDTEEPQQFGPPRARDIPGTVAATAAGRLRGTMGAEKEPPLYSVGQAVGTMRRSFFQPYTEQAGGQSLRGMVDQAPPESFGGASVATGLPPEAIKGGLKALAGMGDFIQSPAGLMSLPLAGAAGPAGVAVRGGFGVLGVKTAVQGAQQAVQGIRNRDPEATAEGAMNFGLGGSMLLPSVRDIGRAVNLGPAMQAGVGEGLAEGMARPLGTEQPLTAAEAYAYRGGPKALLPAPPPPPRRVLITEPPTAEAMGRARYVERGPAGLLGRKPIITPPPEVREGTAPEAATQGPLSWRWTANPEEFDLAGRGELRPSTNLATGEPEAGVSVSEGPLYANLPDFEKGYGYRLTGRVVGRGSDGEPLLDTKTIRVVGDRIRPNEAFGSPDWNAAVARRSADAFLDEPIEPPVLAEPASAPRPTVLEKPPGGWRPEDKVGAPRPVKPPFVTPQVEPIAEQTIKPTRVEVSSLKAAARDRGYIDPQDAPAPLARKLSARRNLEQLADLVESAEGKVGRYRSVDEQGNESWVGQKSVLPKQLQQGFSYPEIADIIRRGLAGEKLTPRRASFFQKLQNYALKKDGPITEEELMVFLSDQGVNLPTKGEVAETDLARQEREAIQEEASQPTIRRPSRYGQKREALPPAGTEVEWTDPETGQVQRNRLFGDSAKWIREHQELKPRVVSGGMEPEAPGGAPPGTTWSGIAGRYVSTEDLAKSREGFPITEFSPEASERQRAIEEMATAKPRPTGPSLEGTQQSLGLSEDYGRKGDQMEIGKLLPQRGQGRGREYAEAAETKPRAMAERAEQGDVEALLGGKEQARITKGIFREFEAARALKAERGRRALQDVRNYFDRLPDRQRVTNEFVDRMEAGQTQATPDLQRHAEMLRGILDEGRQQVQEVGKLKDFIENYFPHIYENPNKARQFIASWLARRPLEGSKSFLKQRTYPTRAEALEAGLKPLFDNPVDDVLAKRIEMDKYVMARKVLEEALKVGTVKRVFSGYGRPAGMRTLPDPIGTILSSGKMKIQEGVDRVVFDKLTKLADDLNIRVRRPVVSGGRFGEAQMETGNIMASFATPVSTLTHEIGHVLDYRYHLWDELTKLGSTEKGFKTKSLKARAEINNELRALADLRLETAEGPQENLGDYHGKYIRERTEKMANLVDAYVNNRERLQETAPHAMAVLERVISEHPELSPLKEVRPSLARKAGFATLKPGGPVIAGQYVAMPEVAKVFENFLSPGLRGHGGPVGKAFDLYREAGNVLNMAQLSISAFHAGMTGLDSNISTIALGLKQLGTPGQRLQGVGRMGMGLNPLEFVRQIYRGHGLIKDAMTGPLDGEIAQLLARGGGRVRMDTFYYNQAAEQFARAFRRGEYAKGLLRAPGALIETISKPIMQMMVPRLKMAAFYDMAKFEVRRLGPEATEIQLRDALGKAWDSVDNRLGQLVYDNLFWHRAIKDLSMASVRSVGWNLGTIREFGGAVKDLATIGRRSQLFGESTMTHRMAYAVAMPIMAGIYGAVYQYLHTGKGPSQLLDYYYPRTGDGNERASLPTYMKDLYSYGRDVADVRPLRTLKGKLHPFLTSIYDMLENRDYFNRPIRNEHHTLVKQMKELAEWWISQYQPIPFRQMPKERTTGRKVENFFGIVKAPKRIVQKGAMR